MCGIFGLVYFRQHTIATDLLSQATTLLKHRGPDDEGYLLGNVLQGSAHSYAGADTDSRLPLPPLSAAGRHDANLGFGFRRLAILDLSPQGHQPLCSQDGHCWIIFNGEVFNYLELRKELAALGHQFHSGTDTEVILAAYQQWGAACLSRFIGMWALAIWDTRARTLFLARDPFGIKPLYYHYDNEHLAFASEMKALLPIPGVHRGINPTALYSFLQNGACDFHTETLLADIQQMPPGHYMTITLTEASRPVAIPYATISTETRSDLSFTAAAESLRELFLKNISLHLRSDVPVGAALSGGIDSSAIVSGMRYLQQKEITIHTFSFVADDDVLNEERWVDIVGNTSHAIVHKVRITPEELAADLDHLVKTHDMPFGSTSIYAQSRIFRRAREEGITVMLDGQGSDEYFAGYLGYLPFRLATLLRHHRYWQACRFAGVSAPYSLEQAWRPLLLAGLSIANLPGVTRLKLLRRRFRSLLGAIAQAGASAPGSAINLRWFQEHHARIEPTPAVTAREVLKGTLHQHFTRSSLPALLRYEDTNSMSYSIESRVPFLTMPLVQFVFSLPEEYILDNRGTTKSIFREAMRGIVPQPILDRRDKIGFATPEKAWLTTMRPWVEAILQSDTARTIPAFSHQFVATEWQAMLAGQLKFDWRFWRWMNLIRWAEIYHVDFN